VSKREEIRTGLASRPWLALGVMALALAVIGSSGPAAASTGPQAVAAKKCKKRHRKRCKKRHQPQPAQGPLVRATLAWTDPQQVDLHVYDASGNHSGWSPATNTVVQGIPNATHSDDAGPGGPSESFTDNIFNTNPVNAIAGRSYGASEADVGGSSNPYNNREFSYIVCFYGNGPIHATFTAVSAYGTNVWTNQPLDANPGEYYVLTPPGGPSTPPPSTVCV
jgi:hypothetical protein